MVLRTDKLSSESLSVDGWKPDVLHSKANEHLERGQNPVLIHGSIER